jgi:hypothetical protein
MLMNFPQDDEYSLIQICGDNASLDIYYGSQFVESEDHPRAKNRQIILEHTPILKGTLWGTIYVQDKNCVKHTLCHFGVTKAGNFQSWGCGTDFEYHFDPATCMLNCITGEIFLDNRLLPDYAGIDDFDLEISYEFSRE